MPGEDGVELDFIDLEITGSGFGDHDGRALRAITHKEDEPTRVFAAEKVVVTGGAFHFSWPNTYERGAYQPLLFFVDVDSDGRCDPDLDPVWRVVGNSAGENGRYPWALERDNFAEAGEQAAWVCNRINAC
jgi:hypothetical protein